MHKNVQRNPKKSQKNNTTLLFFYVDTRTNLKAIRGSGYRFAPKVGAFPTETIMLAVRSSGLWEAYTQTYPKWDKNFTTTCWCRSIIACQVLWISDEFWIYYNLKQGILMFAAEWRWHGAWHSFPFLAWDLSMHPRTKDLIFQPIYMYRSMCI